MRFPLQPTFSADYRPYFGEGKNIAGEKNFKKTPGKPGTTAGYGKGDYMYSRDEIVKAAEKRGIVAEMRMGR